MTRTATFPTKFRGDATVVVDSEGFGLAVTRVRDRFEVSEFVFDDAWGRVGVAATLPIGGAFGRREDAVEAATRLLGYGHGVPGVTL